MKKIYGILLGVALALPLNASAEQVLLNWKRIQTGGYVGTSVRWSKLRDETVVLVGGRAALVGNRSWSLGLAGFGSTTPLARTTGEKTKISYGGLLLEYWLFPQSLVHLKLGTLVGFGGLNDLSYATIFVLEPEATLGIYLMKGVELAFQVGYRYVDKAFRSGMNNKQASGVAFGTALHFGLY